MHKHLLRPALLPGIADTPIAGAIRSGERVFLSGANRDHWPEDQVKVVARHRRACPDSPASNGRQGPMFQLGATGL